MRYFAKITKNSIGIVVLLAAAATVSVAQRTEIGGTKWLLTHIDGVAVTTNKAFLEFDMKQDRFSGNAGCNRMFGEIEVTGRRIDFGPVGMTKMACLDPRSNRVERSFTANLRDVRQYRTTNSTLELLNGGKAVLKFKAAKAQSSALESKKWIVTEIGGKSVRANGTTPFVVFDASKSNAGGDTGCNAFGGSYAASGNTIRIFDTVSTMRACIEDDRMTIERSFMDALQKTNRYEIKGEHLTLYRSDRLLMKLKGTNK